MSFGIIIETVYKQNRYQNFSSYQYSNGTRIPIIRLPTLPVLRFVDKTSWLSINSLVLIVFGRIEKSLKLHQSAVFKANNYRLNLLVECKN